MSSATEVIPEIISARGTISLIAYLPLGINPYHQPVSKAVISVPAGATLTAQVRKPTTYMLNLVYLSPFRQWHHTLNQASGDPADPIDASHKGPITAYLYACSLILSLDMFLT